ncbi:chlorophyll synthesis pathway protein BchC [Ahrensia sp. R2A130]|uniref:chlorophyll synthesis pathway protein BchC n=1 Tax=Ahrensia sp. R2A130 TaxID=744979 RepID=UPI0001E08410|nr:chlorophyll synthesis pathway protein BchC [Ahrensia sp. R2A130]EFL89070.1 chlorophyll synthesis pathway, BchC [Ahrensia sp. R2A130]
MQTEAVIFERPGQLRVDHVDLDISVLGHASGDGSTDHLVVESRTSGISTGTERLLWTGEMPPFPGMGYPLVPGYETVGEVVDAPHHLKSRIGETVFVPGSTAYKDVRGLFGGTASTVVAPADKVQKIASTLGENGVLMALAGTAHHALVSPHGKLPDLIIGHGVLGRLLARITVALGAPAPTVWETNATRSDAQSYTVIDPADDGASRYHTICDASGDSAILDKAIAALAPSGEIVLAGFYKDPLGFAFPMAFMKEARIRIAAQWQPEDMTAVIRLAEEGALDLSGLITHRQPASHAQAAYDTAFGDAECLKMVLQWREPS